jgi:hypothetical protein
VRFVRAGPGMLAFVRPLAANAQIAPAYCPGTFLALRGGPVMADLGRFRQRRTDSGCKIKFFTTNRVHSGLTASDRAPFALSPLTIVNGAFHLTSSAPGHRTPAEALPSLLASGFRRSSLRSSLWLAPTCEPTIVLASVFQSWHVDRVLKLDRCIKGRYGRGTHGCSSRGRICSTSLYASSRCTSDRLEWHFQDSSYSSLRAFSSSSRRP